MMYIYIYNDYNMLCNNKNIEVNNVIWVDEYKMIDQMWLYMINDDI